MRFAVFVSGSGSNLQALIDSTGGTSPVEVSLVVSDRPAIGALDRAARAGIETLVLQDHNDGAAIAEILRGRKIDFIVLAGYLRLMPSQVVKSFEGRMINIHPALLPSFGGKGMYGRRVHEAVLSSGARVTGPTIHLVSPEYDKGRILAQWPVPVLKDDTPEDLASRVLEVEHKLLPAVVHSIASDGVGNFQLAFSRFRGESGIDILQKAGSS